MRIEIDGRSLTLEDVEAVACAEAEVSLAADAHARMVRSRQVVDDQLAAGGVVYGVSTGFGKLSDRPISAADTKRLQVNLLRSHAVGVGEPFTEPIVRAVMLLRANTLAAGWSGVRPILCERLLALLNTGIVPRIPAQGSVGASGDLAPLAHLGLVLIGEGEVLEGQQWVPAAPVLSKLGIEPITLEAKEGLSLINGTQIMTAIGVLALLDAERVIEAAEIAGAMSLEAIRGTRVALREEIHAVRPHPGQVHSARTLRSLLENESEISRSHADCGAVQDAYSFRCMPQVHGTVRDAAGYVRRVLEIEVNAGTDNPLVFVDGTETGVIVSGGNFHGAPVATAMDFLAIAMTDLGSISERRTEALIDSRESGLPSFLASNPGLESGFMAYQIAAAALVSECKGLAHPASVDSIPTGADREDHVSMGPWAARKAAQVVANVCRVVAIELIASVRGIDLRRPLQTSRALELLHARVQAVVPAHVADRPGSHDIEALVDWIREEGWSD